MYVYSKNTSCILNIEISDINNNCKLKIQNSSILDKFSDSIFSKINNEKISFFFSTHFHIHI